MRVAATVAPLALLATACGAKSDPYAASLAQPSEHVEFTADITGPKGRERITGSGDFTNHPDRGQYTFVAGGRSFHQVFANDKLYVHVSGRWLPRRLVAQDPQTPAQMFRAHLPAKVEGGLIRSITVREAGSAATYVFSHYGKKVSVTVPRVKGSK